MSASFGVLAYALSGRRREFAIRAALGATPAALSGCVLRWAATLLGPGVVLGLSSAWLSASSLRSLLFEVEPTDPITFAGATAVVVVVATAAAYIPFRRAASLDPVLALRH